MDKIQKFLVTAGRKDLAQEYYEKIGSRFVRRFVEQNKSEILNHVSSLLESIEDLNDDNSEGKEANIKYVLSDSLDTPQKFVIMMEKLAEKFFK